MRLTLPGDVCRITVRGAAAAITAAATTARAEHRPVDPLAPRGRHHDPAPQPGHVVRERDPAGAGRQAVDVRHEHAALADGTVAAYLAAFASIRSSGGSMPPNPVTPTTDPSREVSRSVAHRTFTSTEAGGSAGVPARRSHASTSIAVPRTAPRAVSSAVSPAGLLRRASQRSVGSPKASARASTASTAAGGGPDGRNSRTVSWYS
jgi:hypothetical protein